MVKQVMAFHGSTDQELCFDEHTDPRWAVAYGYCEEQNLMSWLFEMCRSNKLEEAYKGLPMVYGAESVACGDWMARMKEMTKPRAVVCAAIRLYIHDGDGNPYPEVICGPRHFDQFMGEAIGSHLLFNYPWFEAEQGFIDQFGVFMTREEAWKVAEAAGQIKYPEATNKQGVLFSENLY